ncbi:MAG: septal ring lytic transglycosylase RlpA family protein [Gallionella sp.]
MSKTIILVVVMLLTGCAATPQRQSNTQYAPIEDHSVGSESVSQPNPGAYLPGDGPDANPPANIDAIPDAVPKVEPLHRYANRPYVALGKTYTPMTVAGNFKQSGIASWYGKKFHGQRTSSGERYDMYAMTAAHPTLPIPSYARVTNVANHKSVVVRINDRGPFLHGRVIDLSYAAAYKLGFIEKGSAEVEVESITVDAPRIPSVEMIHTVPLMPVVSQTSRRSVVASIPSSNVFLQLGAFSRRDAAEKFLSQMRAKLGNTDKQLVLYAQDNKIRVHIGPYASLQDARNNRASLRNKLGFMPMLSLH